MQVSQGGPDVPTEKLISRYPRTLGNLRAALRTLPHVSVFDNDDLRIPFRRAAVCERGKLIEAHKPIPGWLRPLLPARDAVILPLRNEPAICSGRSHSPG
jgi:predicted ABC-type ATPase